jgi:hypothetical protein
MVFACTETVNAHVAVLVPHNLPWFADVFRMV